MKNLLAFALFLLFSIYVVVAQDNREASSSIKNEIAVGYTSLTVNDAKKDFLNLSLGLNFWNRNDAVFSGVFELNGLFGKLDSNASIVASFLPGIRMNAVRGDFSLKFDFQSGLGFVFEKDKKNQIGTNSVVRAGFGYKNFTLEATISFFISATRSFKTIGLGLRYQF